MGEKLNEAGFNPQIVIFLILLVGSSFGEAYFPDVMKINKMSTNANFLFVADALGNILAGVVPTRERWEEVQWKMAFVPSFCDMISKAFLLGGMALAGCQTKSILYNSCIVWSALLSRFAVGRILSLAQWGGVGMLIVGTIVKIHWNNASGESGGDLKLFGILFILLGCALHSGTNVVNEYFIRKYSFPPPKLCCLIGIINFSTWLLILAIGFIIPETTKDEQKRTVWISSRSSFNLGTLNASSSTTGMQNGVAFVGFVLASAIHAIAYFNLLGSIGIVSVGVMKGLTTAGYVTLSALAFCTPAIEPGASYCPTAQTILSAMICVSGVGFYSYATQLKAQAESGFTTADDESARSASLCAEEGIAMTASKSGNSNSLRSFSEAPQAR